MNCLRLLRSHNIRFLQNQAILGISRVNYVSQHPFKFIETQDRLREKDGVSKQWHLIYKAPMEKTLQFATAYLTFSIATISCSLVYYSLFVFETATMDEPIVIGNDVVIANNSMECLIYLGSFFLLHVVVKRLLSKYVIRLYQNGDNYLAIFRGHTYSSINKHEFHLNEFKKLSPSLLITWSDARFALGKKKGILLENYFKTPECFNYLLYKKNASNNDDNH